MKDRNIIGLGDGFMIALTLVGLVVALIFLPKKEIGMDVVKKENVVEVVTYEDVDKAWKDGGRVIGTMSVTDAGDGVYVFSRDGATKGLIAKGMALVVGRGGAVSFITLKELDEQYVPVGISGKQGKVSE